MERDHLLEMHVTAERWNLFFDPTGQLVRIHHPAFSTGVLCWQCIFRHV